MRKQIKPKAQVMFLLLTIFAIMVSVSSVSAAPLPTASQVYVSTNGSDANSGTVDSPYLTIQKGVDSISENGTVYIADGVYNGTGNTNITISKNMNITGQSQTGTIINGTNTNWIFNINSGVTAIITNLTLTQGYKSGSGGAICNYGTLTMINCTFNSNAATMGGAIYNSRNLTVSNCNFTGNTATNFGGAICNYDNLNVTDSTFSGNQGDFGPIRNQNGNAVFSGCNFIGNNANFNGGVINSDHATTSIFDCTFMGNNANNGGAIVNWESKTDIVGCIFMNNTATKGGALYNYGTGNLTAHFNSFIGNTALVGNVILNEGVSVNATDNWWGSNNPLWTNLISTNGGTIDNSTWLYMTINATPTTINNTRTSLITVSFNNIYNGITVTSFDPSTGHIPDGTLVTFSSTLGSFNPVTATAFNGIATALFTANQTGTGNLTATTDNQTVTQLLTVNPASYLYLNVTSSKNNPTVGETFVLTYKLSNSGPDNATNVTISFQIPAGLEFVNATVDNGTWTYNPANRTVTWTLRNVAVGDPYLYLTVRALGSGSYTIIPTITSDTYNRNTDPLTPFTVNVQAQKNSNNTVNAASTTKTVTMKDTGLPLNYLVLAILAVISGFVMPRRK
jgi:uncharacterized repeat protein (TIGR01451 family)